MPVSVRTVDRICRRRFPHGSASIASRSGYTVRGETFTGSITVSMASFSASDESHRKSLEPRARVGDGCGLIACPQRAVAVSRLGSLVPAFVGDDIARRSIVTDRLSPLGGRYRPMAFD